MTHEVHSSLLMCVLLFHGQEQVVPFVVLLVVLRQAAKKG